MLLKGIFCICIHAVFFKTVLTQCIPPSPYPREPCHAHLPFEGYNYNVAGLAPFSPYGRVIGGSLVVDTSAPYTPTGPAGVTIFSDNLLIEGAVLVSGKLPFLGTVGLEGILPAAGSSAVSYGCGLPYPYGNIGIVNDGIPGPVTEVLLPAGIGQPGCAAYNIMVGRRM